MNRFGESASSQVAIRFANIVERMWLRYHHSKSKCSWGIVFRCPKTDDAKVANVYKEEHLQFARTTYEQDEALSLLCNVDLFYKPVLNLAGDLARQQSGEHLDLDAAIY